jgi:hypothetical protein
MRKLSAALATASRPGLQTEDSIWGTPNSADAWAAVAPPPGVKLSIEPIGAIITGRRTSLPRKLEVASTLETFRSTLGRKASESMASRLRRSVVSVSVAPTR